MELVRYIPCPIYEKGVIPQFETASLLKDYIKKNKHPVDYKRIVTPKAKVIAFGEEHTRDISKQEVAESIPILQSLGFTHMGMEMLDTNMQKTINEYQQTGMKQDVIYEHIQNGIGAWSPSATALYMRLIDVATRLGIPVIGLDLPINEQKQNKNNSILREQQRNIRMAQAVKHILDENPTNKVITFSGSAHVAQVKDKMAGILSSQHIDVISIAMYGGRIDENTGIGRSARDLGIEKEKFMLPILSKDQDLIKSTSWFIHLPQVEKPLEFE